MNTGAKYCSECGRPAAVAGFAAVKTRLMRPRLGRVFAGVCASFAVAYGWDVVVVRLVFCLLALCCAGAPILVYLIGWLIIPNEPYASPNARTWSTPAPNSPPDVTVS